MTMTKRAKASANGLVFSRGLVLERDLVAILSDAPEITAEGSEHTKLLIYRNQQWGNHIVPWASAAICGTMKPDLEVIVAGIDGEILRGVRGDFAEEFVDDSPEGPEAVGHLRDVRHIGRRSFAVGMSRQAYRRERQGGWVRIDTGLRAARGEILGLNSLDGFEEKDIYAVGLEGEIWHYNGKVWTQVDSPTNLQLNRVRCVPPNQVFACGAGGIILRGQGGIFEVVEQEVVEDNLYGLEWFDTRLYLADLKSVYVMDRGRLARLELGLGDGVTCGDLSANDGVLWSIGAKHLAFTADGRKWEQVFVR
jgi:hypothetical protein